MPDGFGSGDVFPSSVSVAREVAACDPLAGLNLPYVPRVAPLSLRGCLRRFTAPETLLEEEAWRCADATGWLAANGFFPGAPHQSIMAHGHEQATVHAEQNAIAHAARVGISLGGGCAYVTHYPCVNCFKSLVAAGIRKVHYIDDYRNDPVCVELSEVSGVAIERLGGTNK